MTIFVFFFAITTNLNNGESIPQIFFSMINKSYRALVVRPIVNKRFNSINLIESYILNTQTKNTYRKSYLNLCNT